MGAGLALIPYVCLALSLWFSGYTAFAGLAVFAAGSHAWCASTMLLTWGSTVFIEAAHERITHQPPQETTEHAGPRTAFAQ